MRRRSFLAALPAILAAGRAFADEPMVLRRTPDPGEDPRWYELGQRGPYNPEPVPISVPFGFGKLVLHWPKQKRQGNLIVFSHSALQDPIAYRALMQHWVSHGFVVAAPVHDDSVFERGLLARRAQSSGTGTWEIDRVLNDSLAWRKRAESCRTALEHPDLVSKAIGMDVDVTRPVFVGHEFGAFVGQLLMGAKVVDDVGSPFSAADPRWFAACLLSPQGAGIMGLSPDSWADMTRPVMTFQGGLETDFTGQEPNRKIDLFRLSPPGNKHLAWMPKGKRSLYFGNKGGANREDLVAFEDLCAATTAFAIAYGTYDAATFSLLASDWMERATLGRVLPAYR